MCAITYNVFDVSEVKLELIPGAARKFYKEKRDMAT